MLSRLIKISLPLQFHVKSIPSLWHCYLIQYIICTLCDKYILQMNRGSKTVLQEKKEKRKKGSKKGKSLLECCTSHGNT